MTSIPLEFRVFIGTDHICFQYTPSIHFLIGTDENPELQRNTCHCHYQYRHVCFVSLSNLGLTHLSLLKKLIRTKYDCVSYRHLIQILTRFFLPGSWSGYDNHYRPSIASKGHYAQISMWRKADTFSLRHAFDCQLRVCTVWI